jgi:hypothetical protein
MGLVVVNGIIRCGSMQICRFVKGNMFDHQDAIEILNQRVPLD